jgi:hypothetical protein
MSIKYAVVKDGEIVERRTESAARDPETIRQVNGEPMLREIVEQAQPAIDGDLQAMARKETIEPDRVSVTWAVSDRALADVRSTFKARLLGDAENAALKALVASGDVSAVRSAYQAGVSAMDGARTAADVKAAYIAVTF